MRYVLWVVKLALFALMLTFAVKNTDAVAVRYFLGHEWRAPLIFVLLVFFCMGAALGLLARWCRSCASGARSRRSSASSRQSIGVPADAATAAARPG